MSNFRPGIVGARPGAPRFVVIHNDAGSQNATTAFYRGWLPTRQATLGFAHVYIASDGRWQAESYNNMAWHAGNTNANTWGVSWEVCQSMGNEATFRANEQAVFRDVADFMKKYNLQPNRDTVRLHREFSATACPHRSWELHGRDVNRVKDYFIQEIRKYMGQQTSAPQPAPQSPSGKTLEQLATEVQQGKWGSGTARQQALGSLFTGVQAIVNERAKVNSAAQTHQILANETRAGRFGNGADRQRLLGTYFNRIQEIINQGTAPAPAQQFHVVQRGETLSGIASRYGTTWQNLQRLNNLSNPNVIQIGQRLRVR
ncbi:MAG: LysM peptidoglycan-binding domain-containing protein [Streptococcaceae bacterium]|nr:LysM peptidoglycan-binding domain-containing protein [Streptococcaceae bacterium]MCL2680908.1 LysM peptidoglycan-binding domain-containing protein [Streptococcaceae bacterium]MCL2858104.1 LysM peptidoglycan-binding domain-containing protein [Streptococcaceae bacterium]